MKKVYISEKQILKKQILEGVIDNNACAGTDTPCYYDEKTDTWYEASWNGDYGYPFGYWPTNYDGSGLEFSVGDSWTTHANACGKVAQKCVMGYFEESADNASMMISERIEELLDDLKEYGYKYNDEYDVYISADGSDEIDLDEWACDVREDVYMRCDFQYIIDLAKDAIESGDIPDSYEIKEYLLDGVIDRYDFSDSEGIDEALKEIGLDFYQYFEMGQFEGRIWPNNQMIGFYNTEQPSPEDLRGILYDLGGKLGISYESLLDYFMIFEDWDKQDGDITGCTISDYMDGNYGPDTEEEEDEEEDEVQYARQGKTVFVPHLANQDQKREFFKDFRGTRDNAVYVPRERGAGSLAAYHAMRYPYGENKEISKKLLVEDKREGKKRSLF